MSKLKFFALPSPLQGYSNSGWGNGYVVIPEGHPLHGMDYNAIHDRYEINVHGGLTYSNNGQNLYGEPSWVKKSDWVVGFDTAHWGDSSAKWPDEPSVLNHAQQLAEQCENLIVNQQSKQSL